MHKEEVQEKKCNGLVLQSLRSQSSGPVSKLNSIRFRIYEKFTNIANMIQIKVHNSFCFSASHTIWPKIPVETIGRSVEPFLLSYIVSLCCFSNSDMQHVSKISNLNLNNDVHGKKRNQEMQRVIARGSVSRSVTQAAFQETFLRCVSVALVLILCCNIRRTSFTFCHSIAFQQTFLHCV